MPVFAGLTALAPLDFADLVANTSAICATAGPFSAPRPRTEASRVAPIASAQRNLAHATRRADRRRLPSDRATVEQHS